jgi:hypothetical protein
MAHEIDALDPAPETVTLSTGAVVVIEDLRARQFFKLLRIITRGAVPALQDMSLFKLDGELDAKEFAGRMLSLMVLSIPEAEDDAIAFVQSMCKPYGLIERRGVKLNKQDTERNTELWTRLITDLDNPELDDLVTIIEAIVKREAADIQALGKRLAAMFRLAEKTGQVPTKPETSHSPTYPAPNTSAGSPARSISLHTSTDGQTTSVENSPSGDYASVSQPSGNAVSWTSGSASNG